MRKIWLTATILAAAVLAGCDASGDSDQAAEEQGQGQGSPVTEGPGNGGPDDDPGSDNPPQQSTPVVIGLLPDTQGGGDNVSIHPMKAVLDRFKEMGVNLVIPVGDLTDHGTTREFEQWTSVAAPFRDAGMEFMPLMGNHEDSYAYTLEFTAPEPVTPAEVTLGRRTADGWEPLAPAGCVLQQPYTQGTLDIPPARPDGCEAHPLVGFDTSHGGRWWAVLDSDIEAALIRR